MRKPISTFTHGILDYVTAAVMFLLPRLADWGTSATTLLTILAIATVGYSLMTRYELGVFRMLSMRVHLALDTISGVALLLAAFLLFDTPADQRFILALLGLWEISAVMLTNPAPYAVARTTHRRQNLGS